MKSIAPYPILLILGLLATMFSRPAQAQFTEYEVKASLIITLANLTVWPEEAFDNDANAPFQIGILGDDPFGTILEEVSRGRTVKDRPIIIRRASSVDDLRGVHIMIITRSEANDIKRILREIGQYQQSTVLTVGDNIKEFNQYGGIINFVKDSYVRYTLNWKEATKCGLNFKKQVLNTALEIIPSYDNR